MDEIIAKLDSIQNWQSENPTLRLYVVKGVLITDMKVFIQSMKAILSLKESKLNHVYYQKVNDAYSSMQSGNWIDEKNIDENRVFSPKKISTLASIPEIEITPILTVVRDENTDNVKIEKEICMETNAVKTNNGLMNDKKIHENINSDILVQNKTKSDNGNSQLNLF
jgi:hypothetical protein